MANEVGPAYRELASIVVDNLTTRIHAYVACFCADGDLLSQWRGYAGTHGYSIEFDRAALDEAVGRFAVPDGPPARVRSALYDAHKAREAAATAVSEVAQDGLNHPGVHSHFIALKIAPIVATIKDESFAEEQEWRAVVALYEPDGPFRQDPPDGSTNRYRPVQLAIVPYVAIRIELSSIVSVTVGPSMQQALRVEGAKRFLWGHGIDVPVRPSRVPFRT
ncbi:MAG TPA: DUF2971 domain-containing protein [Acidimicrobiia bacterium]|jgi:hypothetical protein